MHIQIKTNIAPPEGLGGKVGGWTIHESFRGKPHGDGWLYEPIAQTSEEKIIFSIPSWLAIEDYSVYIHDEEVYKNGVATILCSTDGKPLSPYFIPRNQRKGLPNAHYSLPFAYIKISFDGRINHLCVESIEPIVENIESAMYATAKHNNLFSGAIKVVDCYCRTCGCTFDINDIDDHKGHNVLPSTFDVSNDIKHLDRAIRAAYKKAHSINTVRPFYVYTD